MCYVTWNYEKMYKKGIMSGMLKIYTHFNPTNSAFYPPFNSSYEKGGSSSLQDWAIPDNYDQASRIFCRFTFPFNSHYNIIIRILQIIIIHLSFHNFKPPSSCSLQSTLQIETMAHRLQSITYGLDNIDCITSIVFSTQIQNELEILFNLDIKSRIYTILYTSSSFELGRLPSVSRSPSR